ncbi:MAG: alpha/beta fold hydrolase, partial [Gammaproteobacteria bacterium]|nr:alpha/beta fold hydrolase [Gammaproteobacteria bacterium]
MPTTFARLMIKGTGIALLLIVTIYLVRAFDSLRMLPLGPEHHVKFAAEFVHHQESETDWADYLAIENRLAVELNDEVNTGRPIGGMLDRHLGSSAMYPENQDRNWNRSFVLSPERRARGVAVMIHGLTDSPYSMRATAELFAAEGYHAVVPRMPGHGFAVGGLRHSDWEDWGAAVRIAVRQAQSLAEDDAPLIMVGYSNGGLLALNYALECASHDVRCPDSLVLLSPAIGVSVFASLTNLHHGLSWLAYFEQFQWASLVPEIDPFKFNSFPKNAGWQIWQLVRHTHALMRDAALMAQLPPILTFQSVVDDTVSVSDVFRLLYLQLPDKGSELVVYDVNRFSTILPLMRRALDDPIDIALDLAPLRFSISVLSNRDTTDTAVDVVHIAAGGRSKVRQDLNLAWPKAVFS